LRLRNLRALPAAVLFLLLTLFFFHLRGRNDAFRPDPFREREAAAATPFAAISASILEVGHDMEPAPAYRIAPNEKGVELACRVRYRAATGRDAAIRAQWYREDEAVFCDTLLLPAADTLAQAVHLLSRGHAGVWSVDIVLEDGKILQTLVFNIILVKHALPFRSLMKKEKAREE
jgi:hypothetical protein